MQEHRRKRNEDLRVRNSKRRVCFTMDGWRSDEKTKLDYKLRLKLRALLTRDSVSTSDRWSAWWSADAVWFAFNANLSALISISKSNHIVLIIRNQNIKLYKIILTTNILQKRLLHNVMSKISAYSTNIIAFHSTSCKAQSTGKQFQFWGQHYNNYHRNDIRHIFFLIQMHPLSQKRNTKEKSTNCSLVILQPRPVRDKNFSWKKSYDAKSGDCAALPGLLRNTV